MQLRTFPVTLRQLQYIVAVAEERSISGAAKRCAVSQPSLSAQLKEAEGALGVQLFERRRRGTILTNAGQAVVARARHTLVGVEDLVETARRYIDPLVGVLGIGVISTVAPYLLPVLDGPLRQEFTGLELRWTEDKTERLVALVTAGDLDAALLALEADIGDLQHQVVCHDRFVLAAAKGHPFPEGGGAVPMSYLEGKEVLLLDDGHCFRDQALKLCGTVGATELGFRATSLTTLAQMVAGGTAITLLPQIAIDVENRSRRLEIREVAKPRPARTLVFVWRRGSPVEGAVQQLAEAARVITSR